MVILSFFLNTLLVAPESLGVLVDLEKQGGLVVLVKAVEQGVRGVPA